MERISVKKKVDRVIVTHKIEKYEQISLMVQDIISNNEIEALLPVQFSNTLTGKKIRFVVQNYVDLRTFLKSEIGFDTFCDVILQIVETMKACESHGIKNENLELNCDLAFYDYSKKQVRLIYWPLISMSEEVKIPAFFLELGSIYKSRTEDKEYRLKYLEFLSSRAKFELPAFQQFVTDLLKTWNKKQKDQKERKSYQKNIHENILPTMDLRTATLKRMTDQTVIYVTHYPFCVGRKSEVCDYAIENNPFLSKRHMTILLKRNQTYIRDNGSANGTYVNGVRIVPNVEVELPSGSKIRVGNEELIFYTADGQ